MFFTACHSTLIHFSGSRFCIARLLLSPTENYKTAQSFGRVLRPQLPYYAITSAFNFLNVLTLVLVIADMLRNE